MFQQDSLGVSRYTWRLDRKKPSLNSACCNLAIYRRLEFQFSLSNSVKTGHSSNHCCKIQVCFTDTRQGYKVGHLCGFRNPQPPLITLYVFMKTSASRDEVSHSHCLAHAHKVNQRRDVERPLLV